MNHGAHITIKGSLLLLTMAVTGLLTAPGHADPRVLEGPVPYEKIPDASTESIPEAEAIVYWSHGHGRIVTMTAAGGDHPDFCPTPTPGNLNSRVCRADFLVVHDGRVAAIGRTRSWWAWRRGRGIRAALRRLGVDRDDVAFVYIPRGHLLMPGLVDPHTHALAGAETLIDRDGISVASSTSSPREALRKAQRIEIRNGITTSGEPLNARGFNRLRDFAEDGELRMRVSMYLSYNTPGGVTGEEVDHTDLIPAGTSRPWVPVPPDTDRLRVEGVKIFVDGGSIGRRANSYEEHLGVGNLWFPDPDEDGENPELNAVVEEFHCRGLQVAIHASGDRAIPIAQSAMQHAMSRSDCPGGHDNVLRHRVEHHQVITDDIIDTALQSNIAATIFFQTWACDPHVPPPDFVDKHHNWRRLMERGIKNGMRVSWHSDDPYASFWRGMVAPFRELHTAVTRLEIPRSPWQGVDAGVCLLPDELRRTGLTVREALPMMTIDGAYLLHREDEVGSLDPGKQADLIVINKDILRLDRARRDGMRGFGRTSSRSLRAELSDPVHEIRDTHVLMTMIGGKVEFCAAGHEHFCVNAN